MYITASSFLGIIIVGARTCSIALIRDARAIVTIGMRRELNRIATAGLISVGDKFDTIHGKIEPNAE